MVRLLVAIWFRRRVGIGCALVRKLPSYLCFHRKNFLERNAHALRTQPQEDLPLLIQCTPQLGVFSPCVFKRSTRCFESACERPDAVEHRLKALTDFAEALQRLECAQCFGQVRERAARATAESLSTTPIAAVH